MKRIFSPGTKRKRQGTTPIKRVRAKIEEGCDFETESDRQLSCQALCDCVIACSAAKNSEADKKAAAKDLEELLEGEARKGVLYEISNDVGDDKRLAGTPLYLAAVCLTLSTRPVNNQRVRALQTLDCPDAAKLLIEKGEASLVRGTASRCDIARVTFYAVLQVAPFENTTPIEAAIKHNSKCTLRVLLERVAVLEEISRERVVPEPAAPISARPRLERSWTHTDPSGLREGRLHRRDDNDDGARDSESQPKIKSTRRARS